MILIVRLQGGLGNQLFQYSFARGLSAKTGVPVLFDKRSLETYSKDETYRKYSLDFFNTQTSFAKPSSLFGFVWLRNKSPFFEKFYGMIRGKKYLFPFYYLEKTFSFDNNVYEKTISTYFDGYWQTEKYFAHIAEEIRYEISLKVPLTEQNDILSNKIKNCISVSIHIRRGDYISNKKAFQHHGFCGIEYYMRAIKYIQDKETNAHFFIFSDDQKWSQENFSVLGDKVTFVKNIEERDYEEIILMSKCKHHIISNSSFGWWGAWLNPNRDKIVIAPKRWFNDEKIYTKDITPEEWCRI